MSTLARRDGMAPIAWDAFVNASAQAGINLREHEKLRVTQAIGNAVASAGFHARDGYVTVSGSRVPYCAATDFSVRWLSIPQIHAWVESLAWWGFAAWYRGGSKWAGNTHVHAVYAGLPMKDVLQRQVKDYLNDRTGLVGHATETFYTGNAAQDKYIKALYDWANTGGPNPGRPPKSPVPAPESSLAIGKGYKLLLGAESKRVLTTMPLIDRQALCPVRDWFRWLGVKENAVIWHPDTKTVSVWGLPMKSEISILNINGKRDGYAPIRELVEFSGTLDKSSTLDLIVDNENRSTRVIRKGTS